MTICPIIIQISWWRHEVETFSALLAICAGNSLVTGEFPAQRPVTRSFDVFFDLHLNKPLSKQSWGWWFETPSCPSWRHCNDQQNKENQLTSSICSSCFSRSSILSVVVITPGRRKKWYYYNKQVRERYSNNNCVLYILNVFVSIYNPTTFGQTSSHSDYMIFRKREPYSDKRISHKNKQVHFVYIQNYLFYSTLFTYEYAYTFIHNVTYVFKISFRGRNMNVWPS